ncbi:hypothetical protein [Microbacterium esteraromaticum]|uniref:hypothetical protein n=1 Tax=Microbacterium esteraromaticum TaxID=57043 RepID=UPI00195B79D6|nr:hypothetical protein [Microbacterium esteraromaticum]MBM7466215.1 hypothetical protein [Microbacterium esteraromaticum]
MSDSTPQSDDQNQNDEQELLVNGLDDGTGDPNDDRAYLQSTPPAQVDDEAVREHLAEEEGDGDDL